MLCHRCQKTLRSCEGIKCGKCESGYHLQCAGASRKDLELECGDRALHWVCAICQNPASNTRLELNNPQAIINAINALTEKFELVNKIQLPKLNNDLLQIKSISDRIEKQNQDIFLKIDDLKNRKCGDHTKCSTLHYRRRNLNLSPRSCEEQALILGPEKIVRYRTRRRSYPLLKMLLQLNRKLRRCRTPRR